MKISLVSLGKCFLSGLNFNYVSLIFYLSIIFYIFQTYSYTFTNYDDIYFNLISYIENGRCFRFASNIAQGQGRVQALFNIPIILYVDHFMNSWGYYFFRIIDALAFCLTLYAYINIFSSKVVAKAIVIVIILNISIHYYYSMPAGFTILETWSLYTILLSSVLYQKYYFSNKNHYIIYLLGFISSLC